MFKKIFSFLNKNDDTFELMDIEEQSVSSYTPSRDYESYNNYSLETRIPMTDYSGMFEDCRFKLLVINELIENCEPSFQDELDELLEKYDDIYADYYDLTVIPEIYEYFENLILLNSDLEQVDYLSFDGGNEVYHLISRSWDGEDYLFDVTSVAGHELLPNLKSVFHAAICEEDVLLPLKERGIEIE